MNIYRQQYPTRGDLARVQLQQRGYLFFGDVLKDVERRLGEIAPESRKVFAVACAERLMQRHEDLPISDQCPFTLGWRPNINSMWLEFEDGNSALADVKEAMTAYHESVYDHADGQDGPDDADEDAAAASVCASECYLSGEAKPACAAASRAVSWVFRLADEELGLDDNDFVWDPNAEPSPLAKSCMLPVVQNELKRLLSDLDLLETQGVTAAVVQSLKLPVKFSSL